MKKSLFVLASCVIALAASCSSNGYKINGTIQNAEDGQMVYLCKIAGRSFEKLDSTAVAGGAFSFAGLTDTLPSAYVVVGDNKYGDIVFLENGKINVAADSNGFRAVGTPLNDEYTSVITALKPLQDEMRTLFAKYRQGSLTDEESSKLDELDSLVNDVKKSAVVKNIFNPVGAEFLKTCYYNFETEELYEMIQKIPESVKTDLRMITIIKNVENAYSTRVGCKFADFTLKTPGGEDVSLSDYAGKGKYVLVDFWASWCGPCCAEMPVLVSEYAKYKASGKFEIVGVSLDRTSEAWVAGIEKLGITWPQMSDVKYWDCEASGLYGVSSIPHTVLIDPEGTIIARNLRGEELVSKLAELIQ